MDDRAPTPGDRRSGRRHADRGTAAPVGSNSGSPQRDILYTGHQGWLAMNTQYDILAALLAAWRRDIQGTPLPAMPALAAAVRRHTSAAGGNRTRG